MPLGVYFTALLSRFIRICRSWMSSVTNCTGASGAAVFRISRPRALAPGSTTARHSSIRGSNVDVFHVERRPKCLDPGVIEHDIDHVTHVLAGADDLAKLARLLRAQSALVGQLVRVAEHAMQRRAQFVAQGGEEA